MYFEPESPALLSVILKKIPGLSKFKLIDARFLWTEPHSKRIKVRVVVQAEALDKVQVQQKVDIEFVVQSRQCMECIRASTTLTWRAMVQIRQRINTKRTMYFLEQKIVANHMHKQIIDTEPSPEGLDLYFSDKSHAQHFVNFVQATFPTKVTTSKKLVSADWKSNIMNFQYTSVVEIVPFARTDLVVIPRSVVPGRRQSLMLVSKLSSVLHLVDPLTLEHVELPPKNYWRQPFNPLVTAEHAVRFVVLDIEILGQHGVTEAEKNTEGLLAEAEVAKESDFGVNDRTYRVITHLGHVLHEGDTVLGYDLSTLTLDESAFEGLSYEPPDVILIKKVYAEKNKAGKKKLRSLRSRTNRRKKNGETQSTITDTFTDVGDPDYNQFAEIYDDEDLTAPVELPAITEHDEEAAGEEGAEELGAIVQDNFAAQDGEGQEPERVDRSGDDAVEQLGEAVQQLQV